MSHFIDNITPSVTKRAASFLNSLSNVRRSLLFSTAHLQVPSFLSLTFRCVHLFGGSLRGNFITTSFRKGYNCTSALNETNKSFMYKLIISKLTVFLLHSKGLRSYNRYPLAYIAILAHDTSHLSLNALVLDHCEQTQ